MNAKARGFVRKGQLGMDIADDIVIVDASRTLQGGPIDGLRLPVSFAVDPLPDLQHASGSHPIAQWLDQCRREIVERRWMRRRVVMSLPSQTVFIRHIALPNMPDTALRMAIGGEMRSAHDDFIYDYAISAVQTRVVHKAEDQDIIVVSVDAKIVQFWTEIVRRMGLVPVAVEPRMLAARRFLCKHPHVQDVQACTVLIVGSRSADVGFFVQGDLIFMRHIPAISFAEPVFVDEIWDDARVSALVYEVERSVNFLQYNILRDPVGLQTVIVLGAGHSAQRVCDVLGERLECTAISVASDDDHDATLSVASGLSYRGVDG